MPRSFEEVSPARPAAASVSSGGRQSAELFLISFLVLFLELACIRWFAAYVVYLTFFTNWILVATFVGMSVGCLAARRPGSLLRATPALLASACGLALTIFLAFKRLKLFVIDVGHYANWQQVFFNAEPEPARTRLPHVPIELVAAAFFALVVAAFAGLGQVLGRKLNEIQGRLRAYTLNIGGSLAGIAGFALLSQLQAPAAVWFAISLACVGYFLWRDRDLTPARGALLAACLVLVGASDRLGSIAGKLGDVDYYGATSGGYRDYWSPYYRIAYRPSKRVITVNGLSHQQMFEVDKSPTYSLAYWLARDAGRPSFDDVLVIGAGSGNDVAHALRNGAKRIDAVEIDPVIARIGREEHPNKPYADPRVHLTIDDGRAFVQRSGGSYDMAVYALVDSLTLQSAYSSLRLESFLFTREAIAGVKSRLKEHGVFVIYNYFREGWVLTRIKRLMTEVFGKEPIVIAIGGGEIVDTEKAPHFTILIAGDTDAIRKRFAEAGSYALLRDPSKQGTINGFAPPPNLGDAIAGTVAPAVIRETMPPLAPSDDWPFLYLREASIPRHSLVGLAIMAVLSLAALWLLSPGHSLSLQPHFLFLGAGFMLLETAAVTRMAVLFGSTWKTNSIVFFSILTMALMSSLYVLKVKPRRLAGYYVALIASLALNLAVPMSWLFSDDMALRLLKSCSVMFLPIFFGGVIFSTSFAESRDPDLDFGANIAGVVLGSLLEFASLMIGYRWLFVLAMALYALSLTGLRRLRTAE